MADDAHRVALVLDPSFGARLRELSRAMHVWAVRSQSNESVAEGLRRDSPGHSLDSGVTLFDAPHETPQEACLSIIETIDLHHGEYSHDSPLRMIEVYGAKPTPPVREELASFGFAHIEARADGFIAGRTP